MNNEIAITLFVLEISLRIIPTNKNFSMIDRVKKLLDFFIKNKIK